MAGARECNRGLSCSTLWYWLLIQDRLNWIEFSLLVNVFRLNALGTPGTLLLELLTSLIDEADY